MKLARSTLLLLVTLAATRVAPAQAHVFDVLVGVLCAIPILNILPTALGHCREVEEPTLAPTPATCSSLSPWPKDILLDETDGEVVHCAGAFAGFTGGKFQDLIVQSSGLPVVINRFTENWDNYPWLRNDEGEPWAPFPAHLVIVKSNGNCGDEPIEISASITTEGGAVKLTIQPNVQLPTTNNNTTDVFLPSSITERKYQCVGCFRRSVSSLLSSTNERPEDDSPSPPQSDKTTLPPFTAAPKTAAPQMTTATTSVQGETPLCQINVEVVYPGCFGNPALVVAPAFQLRNVYTKEGSDTNGLNCQCHTEFWYAAPGDPPEWWESPGDVFDDPFFTPNNNVTETILPDGTVAYSIPAAEFSNCYIAIGRPFRDGKGALVSSRALTGTENRKAHHRWSASTKTSEVQLQVQPIIDESKYVAGSLAAEWTNRALGEHASIASFASFTIALMTNEAPPELVRDALSAAQDELRHAEVSFAMASLLAGGEAVEPSSLPLEALRFERNKTALAIGAATEGCVEETLSALFMAAQVDSELLSWRDLDDVSRLMAETSQTIALEEADHSALAWRTVGWVCSIDAEACNAVKKKVLNPKSLSDVVAKSRFAGSSAVAQSWHSIWKALLPLVVENVDEPFTFSAQYGYCTNAQILYKESVVCAVVNRIIVNVMQGQRELSSLNS